MVCIYIPDINIRIEDVRVIVLSWPLDALVALFSKQLRSVCGCSFQLLVRCNPCLCVSNSSKLQKAIVLNFSSKVSTTIK
jgi:hypothetical protein